MRRASLNVPLRRAKTIGVSIGVYGDVNIAELRTPASTEHGQMECVTTSMGEDLST